MGLYEIGDLSSVRIDLPTITLIPTSVLEPYSDEDEDGMYEPNGSEAISVLTNDVLASITITDANQNVTVYRDTADEQSYHTTEAYFYDDWSNKEVGESVYYTINYKLTNNEDYNDAQSTFNYIIDIVGHVGGLVCPNCGESDITENYSEDYYYHCNNCDHEWNDE